MSEKQIKNILVTGGAGFIGSHLCKRFISEGHRVVCVDNFLTGSEKNIDLLLTNPNFKFLRHDMVQLLDFAKFPELQNFQIKFKGLQEIYHLACPTSPKHYNDVPIETLLANSHATYNALMIAKQYGSKFLHASTAAVYGSLLPGMDRFKEDYHGYVDQLGPRSSYNEGKRFAETMVGNFNVHYKLNTKIARIFKTYGPKMRPNDGRLIPDVISHALGNKDITVHGDDGFITSFLYIDDLVDGLVKLMNSDKSGPYNFGHPEAYKLHDVVKLIVKLSESESKIKKADPYPFLNREGLADVSKTKEDLGWLPLVDVEEGMQKTIEYMRSQHGVLNV